VRAYTITNQYCQLLLAPYSPMTIGPILCATPSFNSWENTTECKSLALPCDDFEPKLLESGFCVARESEKNRMSLQVFNVLGL